jgi:hypothetical protein
MPMLVNSLLFLLVATGAAASIVAVVAFVRVPWNTIAAPLRGLALLRRVDTFRWIFGRDLVLPMLHADNLTPRGRALRKRALIARAVLFLCCFLGIACGFLGASARNGG